MKKKISIFFKISVVALGLGFCLQALAGEYEDGFRDGYVTGYRDGFRDALRGPDRYRVRPPLSRIGGWDGPAYGRKKGTARVTIRRSRR